VIGGLQASGHTIATSGAAERQGIVHRLDANTTGLMVVAKSEHAYSALKRAFRERTVESATTRSCRATRIRCAEPSTRRPAGIRQATAGSRRGRRTSQCDHYDTIEAFRGASLVDVGLETGRTHQIRVHMSAIKHPCVGDLLYGADPVLAERLGLHRQWLHAVSLAFEHPADGRWSNSAATTPPTWRTPWIFFGPRVSPPARPARP